MSTAITNLLENDSLPQDLHNSWTWLERILESQDDAHASLDMLIGKLMQSGEHPERCGRLHALRTTAKIIISELESELRAVQEESREAVANAKEDERQKMMGLGRRF